MAENKSAGNETAEENCDIRIWSDSCRRIEYTSQSQKYLCASCEKIPVINREVHHEHFPHLSGDTDMMS
jgi:hypothetical protein